eukprot:IDg13746t1
MRSDRSRCPAPQSVLAPKLVLVQPLQTPVARFSPYARLLWQLMVPKLEGSAQWRGACRRLVQWTLASLSVNFRVEKSCSRPISRREVRVQLGSCRKSRGSGVLQGRI